MANLRYLEALKKALRDEMTRDPHVFLLGEDIRESLRGITRGLVTEFGPNRVIDTPISEAGFTGFAIGTALAGWRPVVEFQVASLLYLAFDQIVNQAQKLRLMTGGQAKVPLTLLVSGSGARMGHAGQHSDNPYPFMLHAGVKTVLPATADDAYGLMLSAIRDDDPVVVFAPAAALARRGEVSDDAAAIPLGRGRIRREGRDVTVVAVGHLVETALAVAEQMSSQGIDVEILDPRTLLPFDYDLLRTSLAKTRRLVVFDDSNRTCGFAAEVAARASEDLGVPVRRVARADVTVAFAPVLETYVLPSAERLMDAVHSVVEAKRVPA